MFMGKRKKGLFGSQAPQMPQGGAMAEMAGMSAGRGFSAAQGRSGPDWGGIARNAVGNIGDAIAQYYGVAPVYGPLQQQQEAFRQRGALLAEQQRQQAAMQAQQNNEWYNREQFKIDNPAQTGLQREIEFWNSLTPNEQLEASRALDQVRPIQGTTWQGPVNIPRTPPIGSTMSVEDFLGGAGQSSAPQQSSAMGSGYTTNPSMPKPETITRGEYQAMIDRSTKRSVDAYIQAAGIRVTN